MPNRCMKHIQLRKEARGWLSDEVVVDFPSMIELTERMLSSFFGLEEGRVMTHTADVELTAKEADEGIRVPLDLPVRPTCLVCGGRGEVWSEVCGMCAGTGAGLLPHHLNLDVPPGVHDGTRLRFYVTPPFAAETQVEVRIAIS